MVRIKAFLRIEILMRQERNDFQTFSYAISDKKDSLFSVYHTFLKNASKMILFTTNFLQQTTILTSFVF